MPFRISYPEAVAAPWKARRLTAADVLRGDGVRVVPLRALIREWEWWPQDRAVIAAPAPDAASPDDACRVAAVVHALCARDGVPIPDWVLEHRSPEPLYWTTDWTPQPGESWQRATADAPPACAYHNVWFDDGLINDPKTQLEAKRFARPA